MRTAFSSSVKPWPAGGAAGRAAAGGEAAAGAAAAGAAAGRVAATTPLAALSLSCSARSSRPAIRVRCSAAGSSLIASKNASMAIVYSSRASVLSPASSAWTACSVASRALARGLAAGEAADNAWMVSPPESCRWTGGACDGADGKAGAGASWASCRSALSCCKRAKYSTSRARSSSCRLASTSSSSSACSPPMASEYCR